MVQSTRGSFHSRRGYHRPAHKYVSSHCHINSIAIPHHNKRQEIEKPFSSSICSACICQIKLGVMKLTIFISTLLACSTLVFACSHYANCWCESEDNTHRGLKGKIIGHWGNDNLTEKACIEPGKFVKQDLDWKECHRHRTTFIVYPGASINNCDWRDQCIKNAGNFKGVTGYCRNKT